LARAAGNLEFLPVTDSKESIEAFRRMVLNYTRELSDPVPHPEEFARSMIELQGQADRWLLTLRIENEYGGFVHAKIDRDERQGWGYILEFYIVPHGRRCGFGRALYKYIASIFRRKGVERVWLVSNPPAEEFWQALGFRRTGEMEGGRKVMEAFI